MQILARTLEFLQILKPILLLLQYLLQDTRDSLKNNDSIHVIAQFECQGKILRSKAAKFAIEKIDHVNQTMFKMFKEESNNDRNRDG